MLITYPSVFFIGPLIYYYQKKLYDIRISIIEKTIVFGLPIVIYLLFIPYYLLESKIKVNWEWYNNKNYYLGYLKLFLNKTFFVLIVLIFIGSAYFNILKFNKQKSNQKQLDIHRWFKVALVVFLAFILINLVLHYLLSNYGSSLFTLFLTLNIHIIAYSIILNPSSFVNSKSIEIINDIKYKTSPLDKKKSLEIKEQFRIYFSEKKPYLDDNFSLEITANRLNIPKHHLSQVINQEFNSTFSKIVKKHRVDEASMLLEKDKEKEKKLITIALESGFVDSSTFYRAFKELKNMSPSAYRKSLH
ncbi:helix-turn-helix domain-containing protein [uncultured Aquimarina sp.]|uniref:helix-turn-helix domain-containing protein n=1 Tax=uncultured Aquimarina sp. TaxID=575652 RepID=UPI00262CBF8D|nr:helix-turn-helix domain-containing protein [uncultured Aquimarina sp.]